MTRGRIAAAAAGILTALLLQATVVGPALTPWPASLPALLVAAVALVDGPATGMSIGFAAGLVADLGSRHPAGVLALCWLGLGLACGAIAVRPGLVRGVLAVGIAAGVASTVAGALLVVVHQGATLHEVGATVLPATVADVVLAFPVVLLVRRMLRTESLRAPAPVTRDLVLGEARRG